MLKGNTIQLKGKRAIKLNNKCFSNVFHEQKKTTRLLLSFIELRLIISPHCCRHSVNFCVYSKRAIFCKRKKMNSSKAFSCSIANKIMWYYQQALCFFLCFVLVYTYRVDLFQMNARFYKNAVSSFAFNFSLWQSQCKTDKVNCQHDKQ